MYKQKPWSLKMGDTQGVALPTCCCVMWTERARYNSVCESTFNIYPIQVMLRMEQKKSQKQSEQAANAGPGGELKFQAQPPHAAPAGKRQMSWFSGKRLKSRGDCLVSKF